MKHKNTPAERADPGYEAVLADVVGLVAAARGVSARTVNAIMTTTYWSIGCRIVIPPPLTICPGRGMRASLRVS